jgi:SNF2 family DNA or RNA helicase
MGIGLNLQGACSNAIFLDLGWNPGVNEQAEDRLHRQGQKNAVTIHIIQAEDTVDAFIAMKLEEKAAMIEGVMERSELRKAIQDGLI